MGARRRSDPPRRSAWDAALLLLTRRPHSRFELEFKLGRRGHQAGEVAATVERLTGLGYLDDSAFAASVVRTRSGSRGRRLIAAELSARGISRDVVNAALEGLAREDEEAAARRAAAGSPRSGARTAARLQRRGFSNDVIRRVLAD